MRDAEYRALFPRASKAFVLANAATLSHPSDKRALSTATVRRPGRSVMNATESEYALRLEGMKRQGEILRYEYEGITLRWSGVSYTADFAIFHRAYIKLIEVKGPWIGGNRERAVERFRHAKTYWGDVFQFEMWQKKLGQWKRLH